MPTNIQSNFKILYSIFLYKSFFFNLKKKAQINDISIQKKYILIQELEAFIIMIYFCVSNLSKYTDYYISCLYQNY